LSNSFTVLLHHECPKGVNCGPKSPVALTSAILGNTGRQTELTKTVGPGQDGTHIIRAERMISGDVLKYQNGLLMLKRYETHLPA
jgi:hypothetical protein